MQSLAAMLSLTTSVSSTTVGIAELTAWGMLGDVATTFVASGILLIIESACVVSLRGVGTDEVDKMRMRELVVNSRRQ